jgi:hypothetical protein
MRKFIIGLVFGLSVGAASAWPVQPLHYVYLNGEKYYEFPDVESVNGGDINSSSRYLKIMGSTEGSQYLAKRELAYRLAVVEQKLGIKYEAAQ